MKWNVSSGTTVELITAVVERGILLITVVARGELESAKAVDVHSEVEGSQIRIVKILPEGTPVTKGTVVMEFDTKELDSSIAEKEKSLSTALNNAGAAWKEVAVEKNRCESLTNRAERDLQKAEINRDKYLDEKGEYQVQVGDLKAAIAEIERDQIVAMEKLELYRRSYRRGFSSAEQVRSKEQDVERLDRRLDRDLAKLHLLENFTRKQMESELKAQADDAALELERTKHTCEIALARTDANAKAADDVVRMESDAFEKLKRQRTLCTVIAPQDGILIYAKESDFDSSSRIKQGAVVFNNQKLFTLPDLTQMQVNVKVHESKVKAIGVGQTAEIRIDGYPMLHGAVLRKGSLPDPNGFLNVSGVKEYISVIKIDDLPPDAKLLPRMSAEVRILVGEVPDALLVPLQAVTEASGQFYCYVAGRNGVERRAVAVGESNEKFIEIKQGLVDGEQVALDARARIANELRKSDKLVTKRMGFGGADPKSSAFDKLPNLEDALPDLKMGNLTRQAMEQGQPPDTLTGTSLDSTSLPREPVNLPQLQSGPMP